MIPQRNISLLSNRLARAGGRRIPETTLELDYCLAWFLVGLSRSPVRDVLAFKGGTVVEQLQGARPKADFKSMAEKLL